MAIDQVQCTAVVAERQHGVVVQLGGHPIYLKPDEVDIDGRESAEDVARTLACFHGVIAARVFDHVVLERMAAVVAVDRGTPRLALDKQVLAQSLHRLVGGGRREAARTDGAAQARP